LIFTGIKKKRAGVDGGIGKSEVPAMASMVRCNTKMVCATLWISVN